MSKHHTVRFNFQPTEAETSPLLKAAKEPKSNTLGLIPKCACEFIGTFFLCSTVALSVGVGAELAALGIGLSLGCMVFALGHISGANFNPAVSLAIFLRGKLPLVTALAYVISQMAGGLLAAFIQKLVIEDWCKDADDFVILSRSCISGYPSPDANVSWLTAFYVEVLFTLALALVVLNTATSKGTENNSFYGLAIGLTVTFGAIAGGSISGGAYNPAVGLALPLIHEVTEDAPLYFLGPLVGGALAALIFRMTTSEADFTEEAETRINGVVLEPLFVELMQQIDAHRDQLQRLDVKLFPPITSNDKTIKL
tara:strand:+ start:2731 stop:3663 length:933 start_codon:yes stop_codon:yes gene_type:complete